MELSVDKINNLAKENEVLIDQLGLANRYCNKYYDCLKEIKEIIHQNDYVYSCEFCFGDIRQQILQKISEVIE